MDEYTKQADEFLTKTGATIETEYLKTDYYFEDDKFMRDIYKITITRGRRKFSFNFGQSLNCSGKYHLITRRGITAIAHNIGRDLIFCAPDDRKVALSYGVNNYRKRGKYGWELNKNFSAPTNYDVLCCLSTDYFEGDFQEFCDCFGYDNDSKIFKAVKKQTSNIQRLFNDSEIELLIEIN